MKIDLLQFDLYAAQSVSPVQRLCIVCVEIGLA